MEAYVFHNFGGIGRGSRQWVTGFPSGYEVNQEPVRVKKEIIQIE